MNTTERWNLAAKTADSIFDDFTKSVSRAVALFGSKEEALKNLVFPELGLTVSDDKTQIAGGYTGESRDLFLLLGHGKSWKDTIAEISTFAEQGASRGVFKPNDFLFISVSVPETEIDGVEFPAIEDGCVKVVVTHVFEDSVIFNFGNVLLHAPINPKSTNEGGFAKSTLAKYLNGPFLKAVFADVEQFLAPNNDGLKVSLPTMREVFGDKENYKTVNWGDPVRHPYFAKCTNRIKVNNDDPDDTNWWWLSTPRAAGTNNFCGVNNNGHANGNSAYNTSGGIAPAFCVAKRHD